MPSAGAGCLQASHWSGPDQTKAMSRPSTRLGWSGSSTPKADRAASSEGARAGPCGR